MLAFLAISCSACKPTTVTTSKWHPIFNGTTRASHSQEIFRTRVRLQSFALKEYRIFEPIPIPDSLDKVSTVLLCGTELNFIMSAFLHKKPNPEARILKLRDYEDKLARMNQAVQADHYFTAVAHWEDKTDGKVRQVEIGRRLAQLKEQRLANLDARRHKLYNKLMQEEDNLKAELIATAETPEQRRSRLAQRARELAAAREAERQRLAQELTEQAFRENCDVLRARNSQRVLYRTHEQRRQQVEEKMGQKIMEEDEKNLYHEMHEMERLKMQQRYSEEQRRQREQQSETRKALDEQLRELHTLKSDVLKQTQSDVRELKSTWARQQREAEEAEAAMRTRMKELTAEVKEFNYERRHQIEEMERQEKELDMSILREALAKEAADEAREAELKERRRQEMRKYREHLAMMMVREEHDTAARDAMIAQALAAKQAQQDAEQAAREDARRRLMAEVDAVRQQQIDLKRRQRELALAQAHEERQNLEDEERMLATIETEHTQMARRKLLTQRLDIEAQMAAKAHMREAERHDVLADLAVTQRQETDYMAKVEDSLAKVDPPTYFGRRKVEWFH